MQDHDGGVPESKEFRGKAEKVPSISDWACRELLGLTAPEFVDLCQIEVRKEIVQHPPSTLTVIMGLERVGINIPPLAGGNEDPETRDRAARSLATPSQLFLFHQPNANRSSKKTCSRNGPGS